MSQPAPEAPPPNRSSFVANVRFYPTGKLYHFDASEYPDLKPGDFVVVETSRGEQLGEVVSMRAESPDEAKKFKPIQRPASGREMALRQQLRAKETKALEEARQAAMQMKLPIKIAAAEYTLDGRRLTILYVSEEVEKIDLGELQKHLQRTLHCQLDLRRIGPRDHAKLMGGYGACGEPRCCARFLSEFSPVSIKMAKIQGITLNPAEITGMCGRLRCCLVYEEQEYEEACKRMPKRKKLVRTPYGEGKVVDLLPLKGTLIVQIEDRRVEVHADEVEVIAP